MDVSYSLYSRQTGYWFESPFLERDSFDFEALEVVARELYASFGMDGTPYRIYFIDHEIEEVEDDEGNIMLGMEFSWGVQSAGFSWINDKHIEEDWIVIGSREDLEELPRYDFTHGFYLQRD